LTHVITAGLAVKVLASAEVGREWL